jgi:hypothetical protein
MMAASYELQDVFPSDTREQFVDGLLPYPVSKPKLPLRYGTRCIGDTDFDHLVRREFSLREPAPACNTIRMQPTGTALSCSGTSLTYHVVNIVLVCTGEQMRRVATSRIITLMADVHLNWNGTIGEFISQTMCKDAPFRNAKHTISPMIFASCPFPARLNPGRTVNVRPKTFQIPRRVFRCHGTRSCTKSLTWIVRGVTDATHPANLFHSTPPVKGKAPQPMRFLSREPEGLRGHENAKTRTTL